jgi:hypothetical protein
MKTRASVLVILCMSAAVVSLDGCCLGDDWGNTEPIDLGTDADLNAVVAAYDDYSNDRVYSHVAVGWGGTVVGWGWEGESTFVQRSSAGEAELRAIRITPSGWWVVGDEGTVAVSEDRGLTWTPVDLGTTADLYGISGFSDEVEISVIKQGLVVVGDDVVFVQSLDGIWSEISPPAGSWGQLRAVDNLEGSFYAAGLGGALWSTWDPSGPWTRETSDVDAALFDVCRYFEGERAHASPVIAAVGADGTMLIGGAGEWNRVDTGLSVDLLSCDTQGMLAADGRVFEFGSEPMLEQVDTFVGARALAFGDYWDVVVVGDDGMAQLKQRRCSP